MNTVIGTLIGSLIGNILGFYISHKLWNWWQARKKKQAASPNELTAIESELRAAAEKLEKMRRRK